MASLAEQKKEILDKINMTLNNLDARKRELDAKLDKEQNPVEIARLKEDISNLEQQQVAVLGARDEFEKQYAEAKKDEEKQKVINTVKAAIIIGVAFGTLRMAWQSEKRMEEDRETVHADMEKRAVEKVFTENTFRFVTKDMIEEIKNNEKFIDMAKNDPELLLREEDEQRDKYNKLMERVFIQNGQKMSDDFEENEAHMREVFAQKSKFEEAAQSVVLFMKGDAYNKYATDEDREFFEAVEKEVLEIAVEHRRLRQEFVNGESDFKKGNGFTKELVDRELALKKKVDEHTARLLARVNEKATENKMSPEELDGNVKVYQGALEVQGFIKLQIENDMSFSSQNDFRKETEMWRVYQALPTGTVPAIKRITKKASEESKAQNKIKRLQQAVAREGRQSLLGGMASWAMDETTLVMNRLKNPAPISKEEQKTIKEQLASLIVYQLVDNDDKQKSVEADKPYFDVLKNSGDRRDELKSAAKQIAKSPEFEKLFKNFKKKDKFRDTCIRFLANDAERQMAKSIDNKGVRINITRVKRRNTIAVPSTNQ
ncbi:MAG: hypothetical protein IJ619_04365 [Eubacterium sp.]|nr:hypothetical protein [Eubacterium sp.]